MELKELSEQEFSAFTFQNHYDNYLQCVEFSRIKKQEGWNVYLLGGCIDNEVKAAALICASPVFKGYQFCTSPKGFLMDYHDADVVAEFTSLVKNFLKEKKGMTLRIDPPIEYQELDESGAVVEGGFCNKDCMDHLLAAGFSHEGFVRGISLNSHVRYTFVLPLLEESEQTLLKKMSKLTQRSIKNTEKYHVRVRRVETKKDLALYNELIRKSAKRKNFEVFEESFYENQMEFYGDRVWFLIAEMYVKEYLEDLKVQEKAECDKLAGYGEELSEKQQKKKALCEEKLAGIRKNLVDIEKIYEEYGDVVPLSAASFMMEQDQILYFHGGSDEVFMKYCGQYALQWHMIKEGLKRGHPKYNFNGISGIFDKSAEDYGVYTFKKGFGGHVEEYIGYFQMSLNPLMQKMYGLARRIGKR